MRSSTTPPASCEPLTAVGGYIDYEHQWTQWETTRDMKLRSSFIWSFVAVDNLDFQPPDAYRETNRFSVNLVFSPIERIDMGVEYIYGSRENKDGNTRHARTSSRSWGSSGSRKLD